MLFFFVYFGFVYRILFLWRGALAPSAEKVDRLSSGASIARNSRKNLRKHESKKNENGGTHGIPSPCPPHEIYELANLRFAQLRSAAFSVQPVPHTKLSKINEIHEKGDRGGGEEFFCLQKKVSVLDFISFKMIRCFLFLH
ncbi:MAG: hypothetical protein ALMCE001_06190 [Methanocorpusculum sp. MCE]|nr:MAG: hypothetical protein ALMCE001_06190 [Methanocorpusculum sp. MCE]